MSTTWKQVVLDVADAWREANDSTAKIPVGELPNKVKEGGENIDPELTTLEGTLQEILEILPFKGAMASGQYGWEKCIKETISLVQTTTSENPTLIQVTSSDTDVSKIESLVGFSGRITGNEESAYYFTETLMYWGNSSFSYTWNPSTGIISLAVGAGTGRTFSDSTRITVVGFATSEDATAYPDDGKYTDGYWYKKIDTNASRKIAYGEVTLPAAKTTFNVRHGLNAIPRVYGMARVATTTSGVTHAIIYPAHSGNEVIAQSSGAAVGNYATVNTELIIFNAYSSSVSFAAGTYFWFAWA